MNLNGGNFTDFRSDMTFWTKWRERKEKICTDLEVHIIRILNNFFNWPWQTRISYSQKIYLAKICHVCKCIYLWPAKTHYLRHRKQQASASGKHYIYRCYLSSLGQRLSRDNCGGVDHFSLVPHVDYQLLVM